MLVRLAALVLTSLMLTSGCQSSYSYRDGAPVYARKEALIILPPRQAASIGDRRAYFGMHANTCVSKTGEEGAYLVGFYRKSPAQEKGLRIGDHIVKFGSKRIRNSGDLTIAVKYFPPDDAAAISFIRDGKLFSDVFVIGRGYEHTLNKNPCIKDKIDTPDEVSLCSSIGLRQPIRQQFKKTTECENK